MFIAHNKVRMHDTDMAGILFFANQFRFVHDALEDFVASEGISFQDVFHSNEFLFVIVHVEADYHAPLRVGDALEIRLKVEQIGSSSFRIGYEVYKVDGDLQLVGTAKTVHVTLDAKTRKKIPIPQKLQEVLVRH